MRLAKSGLLRWMCVNTILGRNTYKHITICKGSGVSSIDGKMKEVHLRWFRHVFSKPLMSRIVYGIENVNHELKLKEEVVK